MWRGPRVSQWQLTWPALALLASACVAETPAPSAGGATQEGRADIAAPGAVRDVAGAPGPAPTTDPLDAPPAAGAQREAPPDGSAEAWATAAPDAVQQGAATGVAGGAADAPQAVCDDAQSDCTPDTAVLCQYDIVGQTADAPFHVQGESDSDLVAVADGGVVLVGTFRTPVDFGAKTAWGAQPTQSGSTGPVTRIGATDSFVVKLDADCQPVWARAVTSAVPALGVVVFQHVATDAAGNLYVGGFYRGAIDLAAGAPPSPFYYVAVVAKLDADGNPVWLRAFPGQGYDSMLNDLEVDAAGTVTVHGVSSGPIVVDGRTLGGTLDGGEFVGQLDSSGNHRWTVELEPAVNVADLSLAPDGDVLLLATTSGNTRLAGIAVAAPDAVGLFGTRVLARLDATGAGRWARTLPALERPQRAAHVGVFASGAIYVSQFDAATPFAIVLERFDADGTSLASEPWIVGPSAGGAYGPTTGPDADLALLHVQELGLSIGDASLDAVADGAEADLLVVKAGSDGQPRWIHHLGTEARKAAAGIAVAPDGAVFAAYASGPFAGTGDALSIVKLSP